MRNSFKKIILLLCLCIAILALSKWKILISTASVFEYSQRTADWQSNSFSLEPLKEVAKELLTLSENDRRQTIYLYNFYSRNRLEDSYKLFILMRLLFDVPENYSGIDAQKFDNFISEGRISTSGFNYLSPLGYDENRKIILRYVNNGWACFGYCPYYYEGNREYDFFINHFPLRNSADLQ